MAMALARRRSAPAFEFGLRGFTLVETCVSVVLMGIICISLYAGMGSGFTAVQIARENARASQILTEKMETVRLYTWAQLLDPKFLPPAFGASLDPENKTAFFYTGSVGVADPAATETYRPDLREVTVQLQWTNNGTLFKREMKTLVAKYGLQHYVY